MNLENFLFTEDSQADVLAVWRRIAKSCSHSAADQAIARLFEACDKLGSTPATGYCRENLLDARHKCWRIANYVIVYRWQSTPIQIIAVLNTPPDVDVFLGHPLQSSDAD